MLCKYDFLQNVGVCAHRLILLFSCLMEERKENFISQVSKCIRMDRNRPPDDLTSSSQKQFELDT